MLENSSQSIGRLWDLDQERSEWYGTHVHKPDGEWYETSEIMMLDFSDIQTERDIQIDGQTDASFPAHRKKPLMERPSDFQNSSTEALPLQSRPPRGCAHLDVADVQVQKPDIRVEDDVGDVTTAPVLTELSRSSCEHDTLPWRES